MSQSVFYQSINTGFSSLVASKELSPFQVSAYTKHRRPRWILSCRTDFWTITDVLQYTLMSCQLQESDRALRKNRPRWRTRPDWGALEKLIATIGTLARNSHIRSAINSHCKIFMHDLCKLLARKFYFWMTALRREGVACLLFLCAARKVESIL